MEAVTAVSIYFPFRTDGNIAELYPTAQKSSGYLIIFRFSPEKKDGRKGYADFFSAGE